MLGAGRTTQGDQFSSRRPCVVRFGSPPTKSESQPPSPATQAERTKKLVLFFCIRQLFVVLSFSLQSSQVLEVPSPSPETPRYQSGYTAVQQMWSGEIRSGERRSPLATHHSSSRERFRCLIYQEASSSNRYRAVVRLSPCTRPAT